MKRSTLPVAVMAVLFALPAGAVPLEVPQLGATPSLPVAAPVALPSAPALPSIPDLTALPQQVGAPRLPLPGDVYYVIHNGELPLALPVNVEPLPGLD